MTFQHVWIFPLLIFVFVPGTFVLTYIISIYDGHVLLLFPYISDTGTIPPESCIFGQLLNLGALFAGITVYLRHRQIMEYYRYSRQSHKCLTVSSLIFLWIGYISCFGMSLVANFQETSVHTVHYVGALIEFTLALIYAYGQTAFTYLMEPVFVGKWMAHFRLFICILATPIYILLHATSFSQPSYSYHNTTTRSPLPTINHDKENMSQLTYDLYLVAVFNEWAYAICIMVYFLTFAAEFRKATLIPPKILLGVELPREKIISVN